MEILKYRDIKDKSELFPLMDQAFRWPFSPREFEKFVKADPRLRNGAIGFCRLENGKIVGYVGVMDLVTRNSTGKIENVGGIYGVATFPGHTRKGVSASLLTHAHQYFREKGYRFSLLNTSPTLVAYDLYKKLGYADVISYPSAYKIIEGKRKTSSTKKRGSKPDINGILRIFSQYTRDKTGFVVRDEAHMKMLVKAHELTGKNCEMSSKGYLVFAKEKDVIRIGELVAFDLEEMDRLIGLAEQKNRDLVCSRAILDTIVLEAYRSRGFTTLERGHGVMMAKPLAAEASFKENYGDQFYISGLDHF